MPKKAKTRKKKFFPKLGEYKVHFPINEFNPILSPLEQLNTWHKKHPEAEQISITIYYKEPQCQK